MIYIDLVRCGVLGSRVAELVRENMQQKRRTVVLVPSQYTLETERDLMVRLKRPGFFDVDVLSPSRFAENVFAQAGKMDKREINDRGKTMAVAGALLKKRSKLRRFASNADRQGMVDRVSQMIVNLKRSMISPDALREFAEALSEGSEREKWLDICDVYAEYEKMLGDQYADSEDILNEMAARVQDAGFISGASLIVSRFDVLTGEMIRMLIGAQQAAANVHVVLCDDPKDDAFAPVTASLRRFEKELRNQNVEYQEIVPTDRYEAHPATLALEQNLLLAKPKAYTGDVTGFARLIAAPTPYAEVHRAAQLMIEEHEKGMAYSDMQVICCSDSYFFHLDSVFSSYRIPFDLSAKVTASGIGPARFLLCALDCVADRYRTEDVVRLLKTGYMIKNEDLCFRMQNYLPSFGIAGNRLFKPFTRGGAEGAALEETRVQMTETLRALEMGLKTAETARDTLDTLLRFLDETGAFDTMIEDAEQLDLHREPGRADQLRQVWKILIDLFEQMEALLGDKTVSASSARDWLCAGLEQAQIAALPQNSGNVSCGLLGNTPIGSPKMLLLLGMNDPGVSAMPKLMDEKETAALETRFDTHLEITRDEQEQMNELDFYKALSAPVERLILTYAFAKQDGTALRVHPMLTAVRGVLPTLSEEGGISDSANVVRPLGVLPALEGIGARIRNGQMDDEWRGAWKYLCDTRGEEVREMLDVFRDADTDALLPSDITWALYDNSNFSVSKLETYASCPFRNFVRYGLKPVEEQEWKLDSRSEGNFYHGAMEKFISHVQLIPNWPNITKAECDEAMRHAMPEFDELLNGVMEDSARARAAGEKYKKNLLRAAWIFTRTAKNSKFVPIGSEVSFGFANDPLPPIPVKLSDGRVAFIRGKIDRIDRYVCGETDYLRIIDYKSSVKKLSPTEIYYGTQLQLLLYLRVASMGYHSKPGGAYYYHVDDPLIKDTDPAQIEEKIEKALALSGITIKDADIIKLMDESEGQISLGQLLTKAGDYSKNKQLLDLEQMGKLIDRTEQLAEKFVRDIMSGHTEALYYNESNTMDSCKYCKYRGICRKNSPNGHAKQRTAKKKTLEELVGDFELERPESQN